MAIYQPIEFRTIAELQKWDARNPDNAPFIKIGRLLLAVDQTGAEAWQPLINTLKYNYNAHKFMLYSGQHGALEGCFQDNGQVPAGAVDREHRNGVRSRYKKNEHNYSNSPIHPDRPFSVMC